MECPLAPRIGLQVLPAQGSHPVCFGWTNLSPDDLVWMASRPGAQKVQLKGFDIQRPPHLWVDVKVDGEKL